MSDQLLANFCASWLCLLQPALFFWFGMLVGRHGLRELVRKVRARFV